MLKCLLLLVWCLHFKHVQPHSGFHPKPFLHAQIPRHPLLTLLSKYSALDLPTILQGNWSGSWGTIFLKITFEPRVTEEQALLPGMFYSKRDLDTWDRPINSRKDEPLVTEIFIALYLRNDGLPLLEMAGGREGWGGERREKRWVGGGEKHQILSWEFILCGALRQVRSKGGLPTRWWGWVICQESRTFSSALTSSFPISLSTPFHTLCLRKEHHYSYDGSYLKPLYLASPSLRWLLFHPAKQVINFSPPDYGSPTHPSHHPLPPDAL